MSTFSKYMFSAGKTDIHLMSYTAFEPSDFLDKLTETEIERYHTFKNIKRKREFVATRILRHDLIGYEHIHYAPNGAPFIEGEGFISISHCSNTVGLAINKNHAIGLDLEFPRENILKLKEKFLSEQETEQFDTNNAAVVTRIWSSKEALYKLAGRNHIIFKDELLLARDENDNWTGRIINPDHELSVKLDIFEKNGIIITINSEEVERIERNS